MIIGILLFILIIFLIGRSILKLIGSQYINSVASLALAWGIGISGITFQMILYSIIGLHWTIFSLLIPWLIVFLFLNYSLGKESTIQRISFSYTPGTIFFILTILMSLLIVTFESLLHPVVSWDAIASWFLGGKAFYIDGFINPSFIRFANNSTPPVFNLLISFSYIMMGGLNDTFSLIIYPIFFLCILLVFYFLIKPFLSSSISIFFVALLALIPNLMRHAGRYDGGYADLPLAYFFLSSIYVLFLFIQKKSVRLLILINILLASGALLRSEGIPFFILIQMVVIFYIIRWKEYGKIFIILVGLLPIIYWQIFKIYYNLPENPFITGKVELERLPVVIIYVLKEFINISRWNFLWIAFLISVIIFLFKRQKSSWEFILFFVVTGQLIVYIAIYLMTPLNPIKHMEGSFDRLLLHISAIGMLFICCTNVSLVRRIFQKPNKIN